MKPVFMIIGKILLWILIVFVVFMLGLFIFNKVMIKKRLL